LKSQVYLIRSFRFCSYNSVLFSDETEALGIENIQKLNNNLL